MSPRRRLESQQILHAVIDATPDAVFVKDLAGRYVLVNAAAARFIGLTQEEILGKQDLDIVEGPLPRFGGALHVRLYGRHGGAAQRGGVRRPVPAEAVHRR